jgi:RND superfamily putative drug exporter
MARLARWCFRHRRLVLAGWVLALVLLAAVSQAAGISYATTVTLPNSPSTQALAILQHDFPSASGDADQIVVEANTGSVTSAPVRSEVEAMLADVQRLPHVASVTSPYGPYSASQVSRDGKIAFATVNFDAQAQDLPSDAVNAVIHSAQAAQGPNLKVALTGQAIENAQPQQSSNSTALGVILALIVLDLAFGALFAAIIPIVTALVAIGIGYALTGLLSHVLTIVSFAPILGVLIGLGVGIDYALFIVTRHRSGVRSGRSIEDAAMNAVNTAGRAVFFAGLTVVIALLGQILLGVSFLYGAAVAAAVTVALTMLASLTLLPALLGFIGPRVLSGRERRRISESGPEAEAVTSGLWYCWSRSIERQTALRAAVSLLVVVVVALPVFTLRLGLDDAGTDPASSTTRQAYDLLAKGFGPGFSGPRAGGRGRLLPGRRSRIPPTRDRDRYPPAAEPRGQRRGRARLPEHRPASCPNHHAARPTPQPGSASGRGRQRSARPDRRGNPHRGRLLHGPGQQAALVRSGGRDPGVPAAAARVPESGDPGGGFRDEPAVGRCRPGSDERGVRVGVGLVDHRDQR